MKKLIVFVAILLFAMSAFAQSSGSFAGNFVDGSVYVVPEVVCQAGDPTVPCDHNGKGFLRATIKMPTGKSILIMGSLETALLTSTSVSTNFDTATKTFNKSTATAFGTIFVTPVLKDANGTEYAVYPPKVTYDERLQQLSATLGQACYQDSVLQAAVCSDDQDIELLLSTMGAHSFNFLAPNLPQGVYTLTFNVGVETKASVNSITAGSQAKAAVRAGSLGLQVVQVQTPFNTLSFDVPTN